MNNINNNDIPLIPSEQLSPSDKLWLEWASNMAKGAVESLETAAKQLIPITTFAQVLYFSTISFSDLRKVLRQFPLQSEWLIVLVFILPLISWLISLWFTIQVFKPKTYSTNLQAPDLTHKFYQEIVGYKHKKLQCAYFALAAGFIPLVCSVILYLFFLPLPLPEKP